MSVKPRPFFKMQSLAQATLLLLAAQAVHAQETKLDRVEVTGSSIKRIDGETAAAGAGHQARRHRQESASPPPPSCCRRSSPTSAA